MSQPTLSHLPLHGPSNEAKRPEEFVHIISNLLSKEECEAILASHTNLVPANITTNTIRDREMFFDPELAALLWSRLSPFYNPDENLDGAAEIIDEENQLWRIKNLNDRFRLARYLPGGKFAPHQDGRRLASVDEQAFMTLNMYLVTVPSSHAGATRILHRETESDMAEGRPLQVVGKVQPVQGSAALFRDGLWHDGEEVKEGCIKWLLRTDVMYERAVKFDFEKLFADAPIEEKGKRATYIAGMLEDAGAPAEECIKWYKLGLKLEGKR